MIPRDLDPITRREIEFFIERKVAEYEKISGQIVRDLRRIGDYAFMDADAYQKLREKYRRAHAAKKKLMILDIMARTWARTEEPE